METVSIIIAIIAGLGVMVLLFKPIFGNADEFFDCIKFWFTPEIFSLIFGKFFQDKVGIAIALRPLTPAH